MPNKNERNFDIMGSPNEERRDRDIYALSEINSKILTLGMRFILTGSYSIEALTGNRLQHNDIDTNIFSTNLVQDLPRVTALIGEVSMSEYSAVLYKKTSDRLEYDLLSASKHADSRRLEIQFLEVVNISGDQQMEFSLKGEGKDRISVPTVLVPLKDSKGKEFIFRVKSLPYAIASWAIRVSGVTKDQKRPVRQHDLDLFKLLLLAKSSREDIILAMRYHPQMPKNKSPNEVLQIAQDVLNGSRT